MKCLFRFCNRTRRLNNVVFVRRQYAYDLHTVLENVELVKKNQAMRFDPPEYVDKVVEYNELRKKCQNKVEQFSRCINLISKVVSHRYKSKMLEGKLVDLDFERWVEEKVSNDKIEEELRGVHVSSLKELSRNIAEAKKLLAPKAQEYFRMREEYLLKLGNELHPDVPISNTEDENEIMKVYEAAPRVMSEFNHVDLMQKLGGLNTEKGSKVAGSRGYYLKGDLLRLHFALKQYALDFLMERSYEPISPPLFMNRDVLQKVAQLEQFDEELYHISEGRDISPDNERFLIATSEQPIAAFHMNDVFNPSQLPIRYAGHSYCFRKEAGSHGKDTLGIFRVHQFEKIEQFCLTNPSESWEMMDEMLNHCEGFFQNLGLSYRMVKIVSGKLNHSASMKIDIEAFFPSSETYRELVSCSNCTDFQSARLNTRLGSDFVHMLNGTMCAVGRTLCCLVETNQTKEGIRVPKVLQKYMNGTEFISFQN